MSTQRLDALTSWRYFAATLVVIQHCGSAAFADCPVWMRSLMQNGYQAVGFFFVLSGFILLYTYGDPRSARGIRGRRELFWIARIARIYPTYLLGLIILAPAFAYYALIKRSLPYGEFIVALILVPLLLQAWIPQVAGSWNGPAWSLSVEAFFYLSFPWIARQLRRGSALGWLWGSLGLVVITGMIRHLVYPLAESGQVEYIANDAHSFFAYFPLFHFPSFLLGASLGAVYCSRDWSCYSVQLGMMQVAAVGVLLVLFCCHGRIPGILLSDTVTVPVCGAIVFSSACQGSILSRALSHRWIVELGEASYGMYILHIPLMWWAVRGRELLPPGKMLSDESFFWLYLTTLTVVCVLTFEYFEKPMRRMLSERLAGRWIGDRESASYSAGKGAVGGFIR